MGVPVHLDPSKSDCEQYEGIEYKDFWQGIQKQKLDDLERAIVRDMLPLTGRRLIDLGCGYGRLADCYVDRFQQVILLDGSISLLRQARDKTDGRAVYIVADINHTPFQDASFDSALMVRVFHHIMDSQACLSEVHRVLCNRGRLVFTYKNKTNPLRILRWLLRKIPDSPFTLEPSGLGSVLIAHHPRFVHQLLLETGFSKITQQGAGVFDRLAWAIGPTGRRVPSGKAVAPLLGKTNLAPWIFCGANAIGNAGMVEDTGLDDILQCPLCKANLINEQQAYICLSCDRRYPVLDGIIDFRIE